MSDAGWLRAQLTVGSAALLCIAAAAGADPKPLWEFGLGAGTVMFMDYRGADTAHAYVLPVPYFVYRGRFLRSDRDGLRGRLFDQDWIELNVSVNATTPVRGNAARAGMPNLRPTIEIGPSLELHVWKSDHERVKFDVRLPVRAAFTLEAAPKYIGLTMAPYASVDVADLAGFAGMSLGLLAGPLFADRRYDDYFYSVAPQFATAARPLFQARGGYAGAQVLASLAKRYPAYWVGGFVRHDTLSGAAFEASPLVKRRDYWSGGVAVAWMIRQSSRLVEADE